MGCSQWWSMVVILSWLASRRHDISDKLLQLNLQPCQTLFEPYWRLRCLHPTFLFFHLPSAEDRTILWATCSLSLPQLPPHFLSSYLGICFSEHSSQRPQEWSKKKWWIFGTVSLSPPSLLEDEAQTVSGHETVAQIAKDSSVVPLEMCQWKRMTFFKIWEVQCLQRHRAG